MSWPGKHAPVVTLYTRPGCTLCDRVERLLAQLAAEGLLRWRRVNIEDEPALLARFEHAIPVVAIERGPTFEGRISEYRLRRALGARRDAIVE